MIDPKVRLEEQVAQLIQENKQLRIENKQLKRKTQYGLVWEDHPEKLDNPDIVPLLHKDKKLSIHAAEDKPLNYLIEGDNYHALQALERTHKGKIDVIYIDPPYNTGNEFVYNDKLVDKEDSFRHSKWLSFMYKRLRLAKKLLADDGVIFVSIDDNEQAQLKLLMDKVFGEENFINNIIWYYQNSTMKNPSKRLATTHEYIFAYAKNIERFSMNKIRYGEISKKLLTRFGKYTSKSRNYEIKLKDVLHEKSYLSRVIPRFVNKYGRKPTHEDVIDKLQPNYLRSVIEMPTTRSSELQKFNVNFNNPKNKELMKLLIRLSNKKKEAIVLDFFAGSGTTGHAVMELNEEDGGNRQFILCTNNEVSEEKEREYLATNGYIEKPHKRLYNKFKKEHPEQYEAFLRSEEYQQLGIARAVTRERLKRVIEGYTTPKGKEVEGLPNNLVYLKTVEGHAEFFRVLRSR